MALFIPFDGVAPRVDPDAWVAPNATLIGNVVLHARASVFYGSVLRGDRDLLQIGEGSNIQDNVTVHADTDTPMILGAGVSVGHGAVLHGCRIDDGCLIGMGSTVLNRAHIGADSLVAAGAVVLEDTVIPPRSLVAGVPAKVRRELTDEEVAGLHGNADAYLGIAAQHRALG